MPRPVSLAHVEPVNRAGPLNSHTIILKYLFSYILIRGEGSGGSFYARKIKLLCETKYILFFRSNLFQKLSKWSVNVKEYKKNISWQQKHQLQSQKTVEPSLPNQCLPPARPRIHLTLVRKNQTSTAEWILDICSCRAWWVQKRFAGESFPTSQHQDI